MFRKHKNSRQQNPRSSQNIKKLWGYMRDDSGAITAEYAVAMAAAVGLASVLVLVLKSGEVHRLLRTVIRSALTWRG